MDGIIIVYKEDGFTSHDVVAKLRGILRQKKIGHTGTLDPMATGVLPVCCGKATRVCELLAERDKTYQAVCRLGMVTDTQDITGKIMEEFPVKEITREMIIEAAESFIGDSMQTPPMYSALKVGGQKLYELAREGREVERASRPIHISELKVLQIDIEDKNFLMEVTCSKGTYIRTLCHDIGQKLGVGAVMESLVRTRVGNFNIAEALTIKEIEALAEGPKEEFDRHVHTVDSLFPDYPRYQIKKEYARKLANGNILDEAFLEPCRKTAGEEYDTADSVSGGEASQCLLYDENGSFRAVYKRTGKDFTVVKMF